MSNGIITHWRHEVAEEKDASTNLRQCFLVVGATCALATALIAGSVLKEQHLWWQDTTMTPLTAEQQGLTDVLTYQMSTFQWLPVKCSWNKEEISILKESGEDGYYVFYDGNNVITYWKIQSGISKKWGTFIFTW